MFIVNLSACHSVVAILPNGAEIIPDIDDYGMYFSTLSRNGILSSLKKKTHST